ncbi:MAG: hypothetical protein Q9213_002461 [Squamulea squamosa]
MVISASLAMILKITDGGLRGMMRMVLGQTRTLVSAQTSPLTRSIKQTSLQRKQNIDKLVRDHPELAPSIGLLPSLAEASEANQGVAADCNQSLSERVAFGRALHSGYHRGNPKTVPVVAFVGGAAGELVRVVQLSPETVGLDGGANMQFQGEVFQLRVQGIWHGNRGPVQQLQFAESHGKLTEWLAVRHGGATSVLRVALRNSEVPTLYRIARVPALPTDVEIRLELEHVVDLPVQSSGGALHADLCFNPWQALELAILDQASRWNIWKVKSVNKHTKVWTLEAGPSGHLMEDGPGGVRDSTEDVDVRKYDGWGALRFVDNGACLLVCNREHIACFNLRGQPTSSPGPGLGLRKSGDWVLDVRQDSLLCGHVYITTSSHIFWVHLDWQRIESSERPRSDAKILLAWPHFRGHEDVSLSTQIVTLSPNTIILLYSRMTGLKTVFTLHQGTRNPSSDFNPYMIRVPANDDLETTRCSTIITQVLPQNVDSPFDRDEEEGQACQEDDIGLLRSITLNNDLSLHESFLIATPSKVHYQAPKGLRSIRRARAPRSSHIVRNNFIVPNGMLDDDVHDWLFQTGSAGIQDIASLSDVQHRDLPLQKNQWTLDFEWLTEQISSPMVPSVDESLQLVLNSLYDNHDLSGQAIASLGELVGEGFALGDIDQDSTALAEFFSCVDNRTSADRVDSEPVSPLLSKLTSPILLPTLNTPLDPSLSQVYDTLMESWLTSLAATAPGRIRAATERLIRLVAVQLQLAGSGLSQISTVDQPVREPSSTGDTGPFTFTLPIRQIPTSSDVPQQGLPQQHPTHSTTLEDEGFMPAATLPTPEPTPSLRSQVSRSSLGASEDSDDTATQMRSTRGQGSMGILNQWLLGQNPENKDWEASKTHEELNHDPEGAEASRRKKRKHRGGVLGPQHTASDGPSSQPAPPRVAASQDVMQTYVPNSSQQMPMIMSQPQPGRYGGSKRAKKIKKAGF